MKIFVRRNTLILVLVVALAVSLTVNYVTIRRSERYRTAYQQVLLDPMGMETYLPRDNPKPPQGKMLVVFLGDSRAYAWPAPASVDRFFFANRGIDGQSSAQVLGRFTDDVTPLQPDIVVIQVGVNDLAAIPYFTNRRARIIADCKENIQALTEQSVELDATVILTTIFPIGKSPFPWQSDFAEIASAVEEVNQFIYSLAGENVVVLVSGKTLADANGYLKPEYSLDSLHLNVQGYQALNAALVEVLENKE